MKLPYWGALSLFAIILTIALAIYYQPWLGGQASFYLFDITNYYEPTLNVLAQNWRQGNFMLWNPYSYCGMPQIAVTEPGLFYPPNWLFALLPFNNALALTFLLHQLLAGIGCFLLVGSFGWGIVPASLAGLAAALCGYMFSLQTNYTLMAAAAWCPILFWLLRCLGNKSGLSLVVSLFALSISTAMMILTGRPEIFGPALVLIGLYVALSFAAKVSQGQNKLRAFFQALLQSFSLGLGVLIAAPGILPAMEWLPLSPRADGLVPADTLFWSANWYDFLCLLLPQPLGDLYLRTSPFASLALANPALEPYFASAYLGPILLTLAVLGILDRTWKLRPYLIVVLVSFLVFAAGRFTPLGEFLLYAVPGIAVLRYPVKLLYFPVFCLILLSARGLYLVMMNRVSKFAQIACLVFSLAPLIFGIILLVAKEPLLPNSVSQAVTFLRLQFAKQLVVQAQHLIGQAGILMSLVGLITCFVCWLKLKGKIGATAFSLIILASVYGLLVSHAFKFAYHPAPADYYEQKCYLERKLNAIHVDLSNLRNLGGERFIVLYLSGLLQPNNLETGDAVQKTIDHYQLSRQMLDVSTHFHQRFASSRGYLLSETNDCRNLFVDTINKSHISGKKVSNGKFFKTDLPFYRFCQITSTAYALGLIDKFTFGRFTKTGLLESKLFDLLVEDPSWNARIYKVKEPMPHAYLSYKWQFLDSQAPAVEAIVNAETSGFDPWQITLVEKTKGKAMDNLPASGIADRDSRVKVIDNLPNIVRIEEMSKSSGLLVLTDHFYPGWVAFVDKKQTPIYRANAVLRAVFVPAGKHLVEFRYEPASLQLALPVSVGAFLFLLVLALATYVLEKRRLA